MVVASIEDRDANRRPPERTRRLEPAEPGTHDDHVFGCHQDLADQIGFVNILLS
jgi:hypothetical protein